MKTALIRGPDGNVIRVPVPDDATPEQAIALARSRVSELSQPSPISRASSATELRDALRSSPRPPPRSSTGLSAGDTALELGSRRFVNNILNTPNAAGELLAISAAALGTTAQNIGNAITGKPINIIEEFGRRREAERGQFPASALRAIPTPTVEGIASAASAAQGGVGNLLQGQAPQFSQQFEQARNAQDEFIGTLQSERPVASTAGEIGGDIATLLAARTPAIGGLARAEKTLDSPLASTLPPGILRLLDDTVKSPGLRRLARGAGRAVETGFEAAVLSALGDGDPVSAGAFAAGAQAGGSLGLTVMGGLLEGGPTKAGTKLALAAAGTLAVIQFMKSATPGGRDRILESAETSFDKLALTIGLGTLAGMAGAGRGRGASRLTENLTPELTDNVIAAVRGVGLSGLKELTREDTDVETVERVMRELSKDPDAFGPEAKRRLLRAATTPTVSLPSEVNKLIQGSKRFREKADELFARDRERDSELQGGR